MEIFREAEQLSPKNIDISNIILYNMQTVKLALKGCGIINQKSQKMLENTKMNPEIDPNKRHFSITPEEREKLSPEEAARLEEKIASANTRIAGGEDEEVVIKGDAELAKLIEAREMIAYADKKFDEVEPVKAYGLGEELDKELSEEEDQQVAA